jgi:hypothetical protein
LVLFHQGKRTRAEIDTGYIVFNIANYLKTFVF